jgi:hypothetical protein
MTQENYLTKRDLDCLRQHDNTFCSAIPVQGEPLFMDFIMMRRRGACLPFWNNHERK